MNEDIDSVLSPLIVPFLLLLLLPLSPGFVRLLQTDFDFPGLGNNFGFKAY